MGFGWLIRVRTHRCAADAAIYVVAEPDVDKAIDILKIARARPSYEYEDLGRVTCNQASSPAPDKPECYKFAPWDIRPPTGLPAK